MDMMLEQFKTIFDRPEKVKKLRQIILYLAVRGKLVGQDSNDEAASVLLERIKEERDNLLKTKIITKPKISVVDYENVVEIPKKWECLLLSDICYLCDGRKVDGIELPYLEVKYLRGKIQPNIKSQGKYVDKDTYLLLMDGENSGEVFITTEEGYLGSTFKVLIINSNLNKRYINYLLLSYKEMFKKSKKGAAIPHLDRNLFNNLSIGLPPVEEQERIVEKVDSLMTFCDKLEKALEKKVHYGELAAKSVFNAVGNVSTAEELEETLRFILLNFKDLSLGDNAVKELKNCILQLAVQGKLVPQDSNDEPAEVLLGKIREEKEKLIREKKIKKEKPLAEISEEEKPFELPYGWSWIRLGDMVEIITKGSSPKWQGVNYIDNNDGVLFITSENVGSYNLILNNKKYLEWKFNEIEPRSILRKNDLLINIVGGSIGRTAIFDLDECANINQAVCIVRIIMNTVNIRYMLHFMNSGTCIQYMFDKQVDNARANLSMSNIAKFIIPLPPLKEQKRIVEKVNSLIKLCDELEKRIKKQNDYSNKLMESIIKDI